MKDQLHREIAFSSTPKRIVSLVPSITELIVDLGLKSELVGVTKFCVHPTTLRSHKIMVGGTKQVHYDKIKTLDPDIILCNKEENTPEMISELEKICPVYVSDVNTIDDCFELIEMFGLMFRKDLEANMILSLIKAKFGTFQSEIKTEPNLKVVYFIWKDPWMVVGKDTFIDAMLSINGFTNVFGNEFRYPEINLDDFQKLNVDVVMLSSEPYPFENKHVKFMESKFPKTRILIVDGEMFSWYGSRLLKAFDYFKSLHQYLK